MDQGRYKDLKRLDAVLADYSKPHSVRKNAYDAKQKIVAQLKDKRLTELRHRLLKASQAFDESEEWKIANQIKDYLHEQKLEVPV